MVQAYFGYHQSVLMMFMFSVPVTLCKGEICCSHFDAVCYKSHLGSLKKLHLIIVEKHLLHVVIML